VGRAGRAPAADHAHVGRLPGRVVQVDPIKPTLKAPGVKLFKLKYGRLVSNFGFKFKLRRYTPVVGLSLSPTMDMLATVHEGRRGVYLWANSQMYTAPGGAAVAAAGEEGEGEEGEEAGGVKEMMVDLPRLHAEVSDGGEIVLGGEPAEEGEGQEEEIGAATTGGDAGKGKGGGGIDVSAGRPEAGTHG